MERVLILGGAGFIGSNLVRKFCDSGMKVTVVDALLEKTGGRVKNLDNYADKINFIDKGVEEIENLPSIIENHELIIDAMGWTAHHEAIRNPLYDLRLNVISHLSVINALNGQKGKLVIYIGSRGQYGSTELEEIDEHVPMTPEDVQGVNKLCGESYYRVYSKFYQYNILSLRIPNCFGENQVTADGDVGLIGGFIRDSLDGKVIEVYGDQRKRSILYVSDLAELIFLLKDKIQIGFSALNINGVTLLIHELAQKIIDIAKFGRLVVQQIPEDIRKMDMGSAGLNEDQMRRILPDFKYSNLDLSLNNTINYFKIDRK